MLLLLLACTPDPQDSATPVDAVDLRRDFPEPPEGGLQFVTPEYIIPAYSEQMWCYFITYDAENVGLHAQWTYQSQMGHHIVVTSTNADEDDYPDGMVLECTETSDMPMTDLDPLLVGGVLGNPETDYEGELVLPDGMAARLQSGTRLILQSHYLNVTGDDILVQDAINLDIIAEDDVQTWAAPFVHVRTEHPIPANAEHSMDFSCDWEEELNVLFLGGHMHEYGTAFSASMTRDGQTETIYEIPLWDPVFRDAPPYVEYQEGEFVVGPGDTFNTHCEWYNNTDAVIDFPAEMCVTFGMVYPYKVPMICSE